MRFVLVNWQASCGPDLETPVIAEPEIENRTVPGVSAGEGDWLCAWCLNRVAPGFSLSPSASRRKGSLGASGELA
jgi:hypothetical protein